MSASFEGHISRGLLLTDFEWNWPEAEIAYRRAIELNPNSATAHHWLALHLAQIGRFDEALSEIAAAQRHDPLAPIIWAAKARILSAAGRYAESVQQCLRALELKPDFGPTLSVLAVAYIHNRQLSEGVSAAEGKLPAGQVRGLARNWNWPMRWRWLVSGSRPRQSCAKLR